jgi:cytidylate kinase
MIITISGHPGSGKGTVGKLLAKKLRYKYYSIGAMRREMARELGMTLQEFNVLGERKAFTDKEIDAWQAKLGRMQDNIIIEGRTSFYFIPHSVKLFFAVDLDEAARRIFHDTAHTRLFEASKRYTTPQQLKHGLRHRIASDTRRYKKYYGLNIFQKKHYDLWIDTTDQTPEQTLKQIIQFLAKISKEKSFGDKVGRNSRVINKRVAKKLLPKTKRK